MCDVFVTIGSLLKIINIQCGTVESNQQEKVWVLTVLIVYLFHQNNSYI